MQVITTKQNCTAPNSVGHFFSCLCIMSLRGYAQCGLCVHSSTTHLMPHQTFCLLKGSQSEERNLRGKELKQLVPDRS